MRMLHPVSGEEFEVNPADQEDHDTLLKNGWKPAKGSAEPTVGKPAEAKPAKEPKAPKAPKAAKAPKAPKADDSQPKPE